MRAALCITRAGKEGERHTRGDLTDRAYVARRGSRYVHAAKIGVRESGGIQWGSKVFCAELYVESEVMQNKEIDKVI